MSIVAISETTGSQGDEIGRELARALGYAFADREIIMKAAERMKFLYHVDWNDPLLYDLVLNTERLSVAEGARLMREALQSASVQPTERSLAQARDLSLAAQARARLVMEPSTRHLRLSIAVTGGQLTVSGGVESPALRDTVVKLLGAPPGVAVVTDEITVVAPPTFARV
jgi:hypothetical protein